MGARACAKRDPLRSYLDRERYMDGVIGEERSLNARSRNLPFISNSPSLDLSLLRAFPIPRSHAAIGMAEEMELLRT